MSVGRFRDETWFQSGLSWSVSMRAVLIIFSLVWGAGGTKCLWRLWALISFSVLNKHRQTWRRFPKCTWEQFSLTPYYSRDLIYPWWQDFESLVYRTLDFFFCLPFVKKVYCRHFHTFKPFSEFLYKFFIIFEPVWSAFLGLAVKSINARWRIQ